MRRYALYSFVISLLWLGFVCAVSFIALPERRGIEMTALGHSRYAYMTINALAHNSLNRVEWICCAFSWLLMWRVRVVRERGSMIVLGLISALLAIQTWELLPVLHPVPEGFIFNPIAAFKMAAFPYLEALKCIALGVLAAMQIQAFARAVISE